MPTPIKTKGQLYQRGQFILFKYEGENQFGVTHGHPEIADSYDPNKLQILTGDKMIIVEVGDLMKEGAVLYMNIELVSATNQLIKEIDKLRGLQATLRKLLQ